MTLKAYLLDGEKGDTAADSAELSAKYPEMARLLKVLDHAASVEGRRVLCCTRRCRRRARTRWRPTTG